MEGMSRRRRDNQTGGDRSMTRGGKERVREKAKRRQKDREIRNEVRNRDRLCRPRGESSVLPCCLFSPKKERREMRDVAWYVSWAPYLGDNRVSLVAWPIRSTPCAFCQEIPKTLNQQGKTRAKV